jgi:hypothetical protein
MIEKIKSVFNFYYQGFREMNQWGRQLWLIILIKLFIMFVILKIFFFPDILKRDFQTDEQRSEYVLEQLTK